jgi:hypothetical protein
LNPKRIESIATSYSIPTHPNILQKIDTVQYYAPVKTTIVKQTVRSLANHEPPHIMACAIPVTIPGIGLQLVNQLMDLIFMQIKVAILATHFGAQHNRRGKPQT